MGGIGIPAIVILGLALIPYLDRETEGTGEWFGGPGGRRLVPRSARLRPGAVHCASRPSRSASAGFASGSRDIPQLLITFVNPGTVLTAIYALYSVWLVRRYDSTRAGALGLFTCFLCGFLVLTVVGTYFRGPNWDFYWSPAEWPAH